MSTNTSTDPVRLLLDPSCPQSQRALLRQGADLEPPRGAEALVWQALGGAIGAVAVGGSAAASAKTSAPATTKAVGSASAKIVAIVVALAALVGLAVLGSRLVAPPKLPQPPATVDRPAGPAAPQPAQPAKTPPATVETSPWEPPVPPRETAPARPAHGVRRSERAPASPATRLREETTLIKEARQALRGGDAARALRVLEACRRLFPAGVLVQERERLVIEALVKDGRGREASARAAEFLRKYPDSPHAGEIRGLDLGAPGTR